MPCVELFDEQSDAYKEQVLPSAVRKRIVVEAAEAFGWHRFIGLDGDSVTMNRFGASAPGGVCMEKFCSMCGPKHCPMQTKITDADLEGLEDVLKAQGAAELTAVKQDKA